MKWIGFILFMIITLVYIWNGKDLFTKKDWYAFLIKYAAVLIGSSALAILLALMGKYLHLMSRETAKMLMVIISASFMTILFAKFFVVMLCTIFDGIMRFHKRYNSEKNYSKLSSIVNKYGPKLRVLAKWLASFGCILMFYGIWFATV